MWVNIWAVCVALTIGLAVMVVLCVPKTQIRT